MLPQLDALLARLARDLGAKRRVLVATSGGPDSQALLLLASYAAKRGICEVVGACGIDHGLRPDAAGELERARELAGRLSVPFAARAVDVTGRGNVLARARRARLGALVEEAERRGAEMILLGHTRDDLAETLLWHLLRGSAALALHALPRRRGMLLRPLLTVWRDDILRALGHHGVAYAIDPSNADERRMRGRLRTTLWPLLEAQFPDAKRLLTAGSRQVRRELGYVEGKATQWHQRAQRRFGRQPALCVRTLQRSPPSLRPRILRAFLLAHGGHPTQRDVRVLCRWLRAPKPARPGRPTRHYTLRGLQLGLGAETLWVCAASERTPRRGLRQERPGHDASEAAPVALEDGAWHALDGVRVRATTLASLGDTPEQRESALRQLQCFARNDGMTVAFARQRLHVALFLRPAQLSEGFDAFGRSGRVPVSKLLQGARVALPLRSGWPVVATAHEPVWLVGIRRGKQATIDVREDGPVTLLQAEWCEPALEP